MPVDCYGDALPAGAVSRMGSARFQTGAPYTALAFSHDNKMLVSAAQNAILRVWEVASGRELRQFGVYDGLMTAVACSPDGKFVILGGQDGNLSIFDFKSGDDLRQFEAHKGGVLAVTCTEDGGTILSAGVDNVIRLWDAASGEALGEFVENFGSFEIVAFAPDQTSLALGSWGSTVRLCDITSGAETWQFRGPRTGVKSLAFAPDGRTVATGSIDGSAGIWELTTGRERCSFPKNIDGTFGVAFSPDGLRLAIAGFDSSILVWDVTGKLLQPPATLNAVQLAEAWDQLASDDPIQAYETICSLARTPATALPFLKHKLQQLAPFDHNQVAMFLADLNSDLQATRERATRELALLGALIERDLQQALAAKPKLEVRRRLEQCIAKLADWTPAPRLLQAVRGVEALELIGTPDARKALEAIAKGDADTRLTREAAAAAQRLAGRKA